MISYDSWKVFYEDITQKLSLSLISIDLEITESLADLDDLIRLYYDKDLGSYAYHKKLSIMINMANRINILEQLLQHPEATFTAHSDKTISYTLKNIKSELHQQTLFFKMLALEQEIENAIDGHEFGKARELLSSNVSAENKNFIIEYLVFKYCGESKEENSSESAIILLAELGTDFNTPIDYKGYSPLMEAVEHKGKLNVIKALIKSGADIHFGQKREEDLISPLHLAAINSRSEYVEFLLQSGADVKKTYKTLNFLAEKKSQENFRIIKMLIEAGIAINETNHEGKSPIEIAIQHKNTEVVKLLLAAGVNYSGIVIDIIKSNNVELLEYFLKNYNPKDPLPEDIPYFSGQQETTGDKGISLSMFEYCLEKNMSLKYYTFSDAVVLKSAKATKLCLSRGDTLDCRFEYHAPSGGFRLAEQGEYSLAHFAASCACGESLAALILGGLDITVKDKEGRTPLHYAAAYANPDAVKILILASADINATDVNGKTPLHWALEKGMAQS